MSVPVVKVPVIAPVTNIYCFKCRQPTPVKDLTTTVTQFESKKNKKACTRTTWVGTCSVCGRNVRQFAKSAEKLVGDIAPL